MIVKIKSEGFLNNVDFSQSHKMWYVIIYHVMFFQETEDCGIGVRTDVSFPIDGLVFLSSFPFCFVRK